MEIVHFGTLGYITKDFILTIKLKDEIDSMKKKEKVLSPILEGDEVEHYYRLKIAHVRKTGSMMHVFMRIPLVNFDQVRTVVPQIGEVEKPRKYLILNKDQDSYREIA